MSDSLDYWDDPRPFPKRLTPEDFQSAKVTMEFKRFAQQIAVDAGVMAEMNISVSQDDAYNFLRDQVMVRMVTKLLTDDLPPEHIEKSTHVAVEIPTSTWQMWKLRHGKRWYARKLVARWPVKYGPHPEGRKVMATCEFDLARYRAYPQARVQSPTLGNAVMFHTIENIRWDGKPEW